MTDRDRNIWQQKVVSPDVVLSLIKPGMSVFLGTAVAEPRTLVQSLMYANQPNLQDLEVIQPLSLGDAVSMEDKSALTSSASRPFLRDGLPATPFGPKNRHNQEAL